MWANAQRDGRPAKYNMSWLVSCPPDACALGKCLRLGKMSRLNHWQRYIEGHQRPL